MMPRSPLDGAWTPPPVSATNAAAAYLRDLVTVSLAHTRPPPPCRSSRNMIDQTADALAEVRAAAAEPGVRAGPRAESASGGAAARPASAANTAASDRAALERQLRRLMLFRHLWQQQQQQGGSPDAVLPAVAGSEQTAVEVLCAAALLRGCVHAPLCAAEDSALVADVAASVCESIGLTVTGDAAWEWQRDVVRFVNMARGHSRVELSPADAPPHQRATPPPQAAVPTSDSAASSWQAPPPQLPAEAPPPMPPPLPIVEPLDLAPAELPHDEQQPPTMVTVGPPPLPWLASGQETPPQLPDADSLPPMSVFVIRPAPPHPVPALPDDQLQPAVTVGPPSFPQFTMFTYEATGVTPTEAEFLVEHFRISPPAKLLELLHVMRSAPVGPDGVRPITESSTRTFITKVVRKQADHLPLLFPSQLYSEMPDVWDLGCILLSVIALNPPPEYNPRTGALSFGSQRFRVIASNMHGQPLYISRSDQSVRRAYADILSQGWDARTPQFFGTRDLADVDNSRVLTPVSPGFTAAQVMVIEGILAPLTRLTSQLTGDYPAVCNPPPGFGAEGHHHGTIRALATMISALHLMRRR